MGREFAVSGCAPMTSEHPGVSIVIMKVDHGESTRRPNLLIGTHLVPRLVTARPITLIESHMMVGSRAKVTYGT